MRQQWSAQAAYAADNQGKFCFRGEESPDYHRRPNTMLTSPVSQLRKRYLTDTRFMICPLLAENGREDAYGAYSTNDWIAGAARR